MVTLGQTILDIERLVEGLDAVIQRQPAVIRSYSDIPDEEKSPKQIMFDEDRIRAVTDQVVSPEIPEKPDTARREECTQALARYAEGCEWYSGRYEAGRLTVPDEQMIPLVNRWLDSIGNMQSSDHVRARQEFDYFYENCHLREIRYRVAELLGVSEVEFWAKEMHNLARFRIERNATKKGRGWFKRDHRIEDTMLWRIYDSAVKKEDRQTAGCWLVNRLKREVDEKGLPYVTEKLKLLYENSVSKVVQEVAGVALVPLLQDREQIIQVYQTSNIPAVKAAVNSALSQK